MHSRYDPVREHLAAPPTMDYNGRRRMPENSPAEDSGHEEGDSSSNKPVAKRRRVTRACDECRRKKIKCNGKQPCAHCAGYSYECTYDQPSNRRRNHLPEYVETLESRLLHVVGLLRQAVPNLKISDEDVLKFDPQAKADSQTNALIKSRALPETSQPKANTNEPYMESIVSSVGSLKFNANGHLDFRGTSSGYVFLQGLRENMNRFVASGDRLEPAGEQQEPTHGKGPSLEDFTKQLFLPPKPVVKMLFEAAFSHSILFTTIMHRPTFEAYIDNLYEVYFSRVPKRISPKLLSELHEWLPCFYAFCAVGCSYGLDKALEMGVTDVTESGLKYFALAKRLVDPFEIQNLPTVQTLVFMSVYCLTRFKLSAAYSYCGMALRLSQRMGLHRNLDYNFSPIEAETRKRTFWIAYCIDRHASVLLGLPQAIKDGDIDQNLPDELDDKQITNEGKIPQPENQPSMLEGTNAYIRLMMTHGKLTSFLYPLTSDSKQINDHQMISLHKILALEGELRKWLEALPVHLRDADSKSIYASQTRQLKLTFYHAQVMLYRPFIHYLTPVGRRGPFAKEANGATNNILQARAAECLSRARAIVRIGGEMDRYHRVNSGYWHTLYSVFVSTVIITFCVIMSPEGENRQGLIADVELGGGVLRHMSDHSITARKCYSIFHDIHTAMKKGLALKRHQSNDTPTDLQKPDIAPDTGWPMISIGKPEDGTTPQQNVPRPSSGRGRRGTAARHPSVTHIMTEAENSKVLESSATATTGTPRSESPNSFPTYGVQILPFNKGKNNQSRTAQLGGSPTDVSPTVSLDEPPNSPEEADVFWKHLFSNNQAFPENGDRRMDFGANMFESGDIGNMTTTGQPPQLFPFPQAGTFTTFPPVSQKQIDLDQTLAMQNSRMDNMNTTYDRTSGVKNEFPSGNIDVSQWDRELVTAEDRELTDVDWGEFFRQIDQVYVAE